MRPEIKFIKVPLAQPAKDYPKNFPSMPQLYLELLENKDKIKQDLINKEYIPSKVPIPVNSDKPRENVRSSDKPRENSGRHSSDKPREDPEKKDQDSSDEKESSKSGLTDKSTSSIEDFKKWKKKRDRHTNETNSSSDELDRKLKELMDGSSSSSTRSGKIHNLPEKIPQERSHSHSVSITSTSSKYTPYKKAVAVPPEQDHKRDMPVPSLAQLKEQGQYNHNPALRNIDHIPQYEINEENQKRELLFKFEILRKSYPKSADKIPSSHTIHTPLKELQREYDAVLRELSLDSSVEQYKVYLIGAFFLLEYACGNFLGFDMEGFTQQQILSMGTYEKLLIELGEKSYVPTGSKWPVELRLLGIVIINTGIFIVGRIIMRKTGANLMKLVNSVTAPVSHGYANAPAKPKQNMKGPTISLEEIEKSLA